MQATVDRKQPGMRTMMPGAWAAARRAGARPSAAAAALWLFPILVIGAIYFSPRHLVSADTAMTALLALVILMIAVRWPDRSLIGLIVVLPFQGLILSKLWLWGVSTSTASHLGYWKELLASGVIIAGIRNLLATGRRLDTLDRLALAFVGFAAAYMLVQTAFLPDAPSGLNVRVLGFRETALFVLLLFGARHAPLPQNFARRAAGAAFAVGAVVAAIGIYEAVFSSSWNHFIVYGIGYTRYQIAVLKSPPLNPFDIRVYGTIGGAQIVRIGSVFLNELTLSWYLILPFAIGVERLLRRQASPLTVLGTAVIAAAMLLTQTRSAILGALVVAFLAFRPVAGRPHHWRTQIAIVLGVFAIIAVPASVATGFADRVVAVGQTSNQSTAGHIGGFWTGVNTLASEPLGQGLGTGAGTGQRFTVQNTVIPENNYVEIGDEVGIVPMLVFLALTVALIAALRRLSRVNPDPMVSAAWAAAAGLAVAAWFLQTWSDFSVSWTFWAMAGAALGMWGARDARAARQ